MVPQNDFFYSSNTSIKTFETPQKSVNTKISLSLPVIGTGKVWCILFWSASYFYSLIANNACDLKRCENEAKCIKGNYSYTCICKPGFKGQDCETDINECDPLPCQHGGNCTDLINDYNCSCVEGLKGKNCEININDCKNDTCDNSGVCEDLINDFKCWCQPGWEGKR